MLLYHTLANTQDIEAFERLLQTGCAVNAEDVMITQIIIEESAAYFDGQRTLSQVIEQIRNRVQLYLNE